MNDKKKKKIPQSRAVSKIITVIFKFIVITPFVYKSVIYLKNKSSTQWFSSSSQDL